MQFDRALKTQSEINLFSYASLLVKLEKLEKV